MPALVQQHRRMTAEDVLDPSVPEKFVELIEGELIERTPAGWRHSDVAYNIANLFDRFCRDHRELKCCTDNNGFLIQRNPDSILSPDVALFRRRQEGTATWYEFAPEVVVEVLSPSNSVMSMTFKRHRYFQAGSEQFWMVDVDERELSIYFLDGRILTATGDEAIPGEGIATGMSIDLMEVFRER